MQPASAQESQETSAESAAVRDEASRGPVRPRGEPDPVLAKRPKNSWGSSDGQEERGEIRHITRF